MANNGSLLRLDHTFRSTEQMRASPRGVRRPATVRQVQDCRPRPTKAQEALFSTAARRQRIIPQAEEMMKDNTTATRTSPGVVGVKSPPR